MNYLLVLSEDVQEEAAQQIAAKLKAMLGEADVNDPDVWQVLAKERGCRIHPFCIYGGAPGRYGPGNTEGTGVIEFNVAYPLHTQARVLAHELAHHELHWWIPPSLRSSADMHCYEGDVNDIRHQIARRVEELIFG